MSNEGKFLKTTSDLHKPIQGFEPNTVHCDVREQSDSMRTTPIKRQKYAVITSNDVNVRVNSDKGTPAIRDMCQLSDGTILLLDCENDRLKRLDEKYKVKDFFQFEAKTRSLCSVSSSEVAVRLRDHTIHLINVGKTLSHKRQVPINHPGIVNDGLACCSDRFWITGRECLCIYSLSDGSLLKKIETDSKGRNIFLSKQSPLRICVSNDGSMVYVSAWKDRIIVFNADGDYIREIRDGRLDGSRGVCVTCADIVLVSGYRSRNVLMFDMDSQYLGKLVTSTDMSNRPWSMCYDRMKCCLLVSGGELTHGSDFIQVFDIQND